MNLYSDRWVDLFLRPVNPAQTLREIEFLARVLPRDRCPKILDLCCGLGRHSAALAQIGYEVTGVDRDARLIAEASAAHPAARFIQLDMRGLDSLNELFDGILCIWQSFGYFDSQTNERILCDIAARLRPLGRFVLDVYHRGFFEVAPSVREYNHGDLRIIEHKSMVGNRLQVRLDYGSDGCDEFDWEVFHPHELRQLVSRYGLHLQLSCTDFDEHKPETPTMPRMQMMFEKA